MRRRRPFGKLRAGRGYLEMRLNHQARAIAAIAGRLDLVQQDAEMALEALTEAESRIADLESRMDGARDIVPLPPRAAGAVARWAPFSEARRLLIGSDGAKVEH